jgi:hypothetical protein
VPGTVFERFLGTSFIAPLVFFQQDIGVGGGLSLTDIDFREQRRREFLGALLSYTSEGQQSYHVLWRRWLYHEDLPGGGVVQEERSFLGITGGYQKTLTRRFFGLGPDTRPSAESSYTDEVLDLDLRGDVALPRAGSDWVLTLGLRGAHHALAPGRVSGVPTTDRAFPDLFGAGDGVSSVGLVAGLRYDTRDSQAQPYSGWRAGVLVDAAPWQSTGEAGAVLTGYANVAIPVPPLFHSGGDPDEENPPTDVLALGGAVETTLGTVPFYNLPSLGGPATLRGYIANRFTDDSAWNAVAEYRFWVLPRGFWLLPPGVWDRRIIRVERLGLALFAEAGTVAARLDDLPSARVHTDYGIGVLVAFERTALFRADFGFSGEGLNFTLAYGLSF